MANTKEQAEILIESLAETLPYKKEREKLHEQYSVGALLMTEEERLRAKITDSTPWPCDHCDAIAMIHDEISGSLYCCDHFEGLVLEGGRG